MKTALAVAAAFVSPIVFTKHAADAAEHAPGGRRASSTGAGHTGKHRNAETGAWLQDRYPRHGAEVTARHRGVRRRNIFVSSREEGTITVVSPDGKTMKQVLALENVHGMVLHGGSLYYVTINEAYVARINPDGTRGTSKMIIKGLPDAGQHVDRTLTSGRTGKLYVSVGGTRWAILCGISVAR